LFEKPNEFQTLSAQEVGVEQCERNEEFGNQVEETNQRLFQQRRYQLELGKYPNDSKR
jgi:hypothetical protein